MKKNTESPSLKTLDDSPLPIKMLLDEIQSFRDLGKLISPKLKT